MDELFVNTDIIREYDAEDEELENLFYSYCAEVDETQNEIKVLKENQNRLQSIQKVTISSCDSPEKSITCDNECICSTLKKEIWKLRMEMILKNRQIQTLKLQLFLIHSENDLHILKRKRLSEAHSNKISKLKAEIEQLKMAMLGTKGKECEVCKQRIINKRYQICQIMLSNISIL
ncbi:hypothetical protein ALC60_13292 [Trachymyrmex zeteki]|uniref:Uncharacterized protein n=1 Tax=Mycetomoellerius zeteki TaxID=64791 RepID=A0A151WI76_9HYME|nr:hypothetical protein ALC60_13292 [Trachymyrmex zeteki]